MDIREEIFSHSEELWILCISDRYMSHPLTPLLDSVDWYNNQLLAKSLLNNRIELKLGSQSLIATTGLTPAKRILVMGLGLEDELGNTEAKKFCQDVSRALKNLHAPSAVLIFTSSLPAKFIADVEKSRTSFDGLTHVKIITG